MNIALGMISRFGHIARDDSFGAVDISGLVYLNARVLTRLQEGGKKGMLAIKTHQNQQVSPVHHRHEARFHRHPVGVFNTGRQTVNVDQIAADGASKIRQIGKRCNDADLFRVSGHRPPAQYSGKCDDQ